MRKPRAGGRLIERGDQRLFLEHIHVAAGELLKYATELLYGDDPKAERTTRRDAQRKRIVELAHTGRGSDCEAAKGTVWGAYNAATEYADHIDGKTRKDEDVLKSLWFGAREQFKVRAFEMANVLVEKN